ncbi:MAG: PIG-L family deacetylase [Candidatus Solibacter usitatus]|nr:PIG-L family deacetylase [Candidatus Solibacter usitatus]
MIGRLVASSILLGGIAFTARAQTVLGVFAHPDDEVYWGTGALLAKYAQEGYSVHIATVTLGQIGVTTFANIPAGAELGAARAEELRCSAEALGIQPAIAYGFFDQALTTTVVMDEFARKLRQTINQVKPDVIITHGPDGLSGHIDHRITNVITTQVFQERERLQHHPKRLYYLVYPETRIPLASGATDGRKQYNTATDLYITTEIDARAGDAAADKSLECHKSQMTPAAMETMKRLRKTTLSSIVYLRLAMTDGPWPSGKETTLFEP